MPPTRFRSSSAPLGATIEALGRSDAFLEFQERLSRAAKVDRPVLLVGERGTGKELAAARLHYLSPRWREPFVALNCSALAPTLVESELFGHEAGAFTGAVSRRRGRFESAEGGTLFLDEIAAMPLETQEKILRVVEYGVFERVGGSVPVQTDVRILGAANADLPRMAEEGKFKRDLLDRLSFEVLTLPPLRERGEDIHLLAFHFASRMAMEMELPNTPEFSEEALEALSVFPWPGNVRELKNVVERAVYLSGGEIIEEIVFDPFQSPYKPPHAAPDGPGAPRNAESTSPRCKSAPALPISLRDEIRELEQNALNLALARAKHNQRKAAKLLGMSYDQFRGLYRKYTPE
jgi:psp operon transcriptional activator